MKTTGYSESSAKREMYSLNTFIKINNLTTS